MPKRAMVAYVPVLHRGYMNFFEKYSDIKTLFLVDRQELIALIPSLEKDIRALSAQEMKPVIEALGIFEEVRILHGSEELESFDELIISDDEALRAFAEKFLKGKKIIFDSIFLRWDSKRSLQEKHVKPDVEITTDELHQQFVKKSEELAQHSADWWRQVGGLIARDGVVILSGYNHHVPNEQQPYYDGDPRGNFHKGEYIEISTAHHAEQSLIAEAARRGIALEGADLYVTTFPCPVCAKLVAYSGVKRLFFKDGYSMVDGEELMRSKGVEIVKVVGD